MQDRTYQLSEIMTEKQLQKIQLFQKVKRIKGQFIFKFIYQKSKFIQIKDKKQLSKLQDKKYFIFILKGQILIYKTHSENKQQVINQQTKSKYISNKSFIRTYEESQFFGYQDYPLYWNQKLIFQAATNSQILIFPIQFLYKIFNKVIPLVSIQNTAEYLKKLPIFQSIQLQKLFRLSSFCKRIRTYMDTNIFKQNQKIEDIIILYDGRFAVYNQQGYYKELQRSSIIGSLELSEGKNNYKYNGKSLAQCDFIIVPLKQYLKVIQIKNQLKQSYNMDQSQKKLTFKKISNFKLQTQSIEYSIPSKQETNTIERQSKSRRTNYMKRGKGSSFGYSPSLQIYQHESKQKIRPASAVSTYNKTHIRNITYCNNGRQLFVNKTQLNFYKDQDEKDQLKMKQKSKQKINFQLQNVTLGQLCLMKFINRKQRIQQKEMEKYIKSKAPELVLNPHKQFGLIKGLQAKNSPYIKKLKRKIKDSNRKGKIQYDYEEQLYQIKNQSQSKMTIAKPKQFEIKCID